MRVLSWNMRRARADSVGWRVFLGISPDVAMLQEVSGIPETVRSQFTIFERRCTNMTGQPQRFLNCLLVRSGELAQFRLLSSVAWVNAAADSIAGSFVSGLWKSGETSILLVGVHSPAWPISRGLWMDVDVSQVKLTLNRNVWGPDLLLSMLRDAHHPAIVAGDFNMSETFDSWSGGPRGNKEHLDRMTAAGFSDCLRDSQGALTPTFRNPRGGRVLHQIDYLFTTRELRERLVECNVLDSVGVFEEGISDHLPVLGVFRHP